MKGFMYKHLLAIFAGALLFGCSSTNQFNPDKQEPELEISDLAACPPGVDPDEAPSWVCNPFEVVSNRFPHAVVSRAYFPNASQSFNKRLAVARGRVEIAKEMGVYTGAQLEDYEGGQTGNAQSIIGLTEKLNGVFIRQTRPIGTYYDTDGRVHVLVVYDTHTLKQYKPQQTDNSEKKPVAGGVTDYDTFKSSL